MEQDLKSPKFRIEWKLVLGLGWMVFNLSLAAWWLIFGLRQIDFVQGVIPHFAPEQAGRVADFVRQQRMLISEGSILIVSLILGGGALLYYIVRERKRSLQIQQFFASFSHELKTSIASLRLQAESLADDLRGATPNPLLDRLVRDTVRLEIQLENSLHLSQIETSGLFFERIDLRKSLASLEHQWPGISIEVEGDTKIRADHRALETILKNLIQNAVVHGGAQRISFRVREPQEGFVTIVVKDDGAGFRGEARKLGELFARHNARSGSGVGIFLVKTLVSRMQGKVRFDASNQGRGFALEIDLPADGGAA